VKSNELDLETEDKTVQQYIMDRRAYLGYMALI